MTRSKETILLVVLTVLGAAVRGFRLGAQSLWLDELFSVVVARRDWAPVILGTVQGDTNPPLFNLFLHIALQFGSDEVAARTVSVLFSVATIPLFYWLARTLFDARVALAASALLVINPFQILFAQEARMYAQLAFLSLAALVFFWRAWKDGRASDWVLFAAFETFAFYTHSLAFLSLVALDLFALTQRAAWRERWRALVLAHLTIGVLFAPWTIVLLQQTARVQAGFWGMMPSLLALLTTPYLFLFGNAAPAFVVPFALFITFGLLVFGGLAARRAIIARRAESAGLVFALVVLGVPLLTLYFVSLVRPIFVERTLIVASLGLYLLLGWVAACAVPRGLHLVLSGLLLVTMGAVLPNYYFNPDAQKPPMREAVRAVAAQFQPGDVVAHTSDSSALAFMYYAPQLPNRFLAGDPDYVSETTRGRSGLVAGLVPEELDAVVAGHLRVWLVVALDHNEEYQKARVAELDAWYHRDAMSDVHAISLILYRITQR
jgi:uncharacterized membrane protein